MRFSVIGTSDDVIGFALAGSPGIVCTTEEMVSAALEAECRDPAVAVVLVSEHAAILAPAGVLKWQAASRAPVLIVLPGMEHSDRADREHPEMNR